MTETKKYNLDGRILIRVTSTDADVINVVGGVATTRRCPVKGGNVVDVVVTKLKRETAEIAFSVKIGRPDASGSSSPPKTIR